MVVLSILHLQYSTVQYSTVHCSAEHSFTALHCTVQYSTLQNVRYRTYGAVQHCTECTVTVQCSSVPSPKCLNIHSSAGIRHHKYSSSFAFKIGQKKGNVGCVRECWVCEGVLGVWGSVGCVGCVREWRVECKLYWLLVNAQMIYCHHERGWQEVQVCKALWDVWGSGVGGR
jgi:hypothetical protein